MLEAAGSADGSGEILAMGIDSVVGFLDKEYGATEVVERLWMSRIHNVRQL